MEINLKEEEKEQFLMIDTLLKFMIEKGTEDCRTLANSLHTTIECAINNNTLDVINTGDTFAIIDFMLAKLENLLGYKLENGCTDRDYISYADEIHYISQAQDTLNRYSKELSEI